MANSSPGMRNLVWGGALEEMPTAAAASPCSAADVEDTSQPRQSKARRGSYHALFKDGAGACSRLSAAQRDAHQQQKRVKQVLMGASVLNTSTADQAPADHNLYFRPRPALERDWFQMPKPPKLAYQREQFFANLLRKANNPRGGKSRRPSYEKMTLGKTERQAGKRPGTSEHACRPNTSDGSQPPTVSQRMNGGFAGIKLTRPSTSPASPSPSPCMRYSTQRVVQPEDALSSKSAGFKPMNHRRDYNYRSTPLTSTVALVPYDVQVSDKNTTTATNEKSEAENDEEEKRWLEMSNMTDCHHRELRGMKNEISLLRKELEQGLMEK